MVPHLANSIYDMAQSCPERPGTYFTQVVALYQSNYGQLNLKTSMQNPGMLLCLIMEQQTQLLESAILTSHVS